MTFFETFNLLGHHPALYISLAAIIGLLVGSFLNVVIYRLPLILAAEGKVDACEYLGLPVVPPYKLSLSVPGSSCPCCRKPIRPWQNIPVLSWCFLRGKCSCCKTSISLRYPFVELMGGLVTAVIVWQFGLTLEAFAFSCVAWAVIALALIDFDTMLLPDVIVLPLIWAGLLATIWLSPADIAAHVLGASAGYLFFRVLPIGRGDAKLAAAAGAWLGWTALPLVISAGAILSALMGVIYYLRLGKSKPYPFGPALGVGFILAIFFADDYARYLGLL